MGAYKDYLNYLKGLGLELKGHYDYKNKDYNVACEIERFYNRSCMMFQYHNLPDTIPQLELEKILQTQGYAIIGQIEGKLYACYGGLGGVLDEYNRPTQAIVSIPYLHFNANWDIGTECVIIKNDLMEQGLLPLYAKYLTLQNETEITLLMSLINGRMQTLISASDTQTMESAKEYLNKIIKGDFGVIADNMMFESLKTKPTDNADMDYSKITEVLHYLRGQLYNEIGLATNYNLKKERITQAEVELNTDNLYPMIDNMMLCRRLGLEECYNLFGVDWQVEFNSSWDYRIMNGEPIVTEGDKDDIISDNILSGVDSNDTDNDSDNTGTIELSNIQEQDKTTVSDTDTDDSTNNISMWDSDDNSDISETIDTNVSELNELEQTVINRIEDNIVEVAENVAKEIVDTLSDDTIGNEDKENE